MGHVFNYNLPLDKAEGGVDTSQDTVTADKMLMGYTAHDASGEQITGTIEPYAGFDDSAPYEMKTPAVTFNTAGKYVRKDIPVVAKLQEKTATTGEVVTADAGYAGLKSVDTTPVFEAGKKSEHDVRWDEIQENGEKTYYSFFFAGDSWTAQTFKPKYDIHVKIGDYMFAGSLGGVNLQQLLDECGVVLDTSQSSSFSNFFRYSSPAVAPTIDTRSANNLDMMFMAASVVSASIILRDDETQYLNRVFYSCAALENLAIVGCIGQSFDIRWSSKLTRDSITSIINALSSKTTGIVVWISLTAVNTAFETSAGSKDGSTSDEWLALIATKPNWTIALV